MFDKGVEVDLFEDDFPDLGSEIMTSKRVIRKGASLNEFPSLYAWMWSRTNKQFYHES